MIVFHSPCGTWLISRSPRRQRPLRRIILMVTAVSSIKTSRVVSRKPCCRIQRRRARATSARCCSAARRLFFERDAMAIKEPPERAAATRNPSLVHRHNKLVQRSVWLLVDERKDALGIVFQNRAATAPRFRHALPMITPTLQPFDSTAGTDLKALGRLTSRRSRLHCFDNSLTQVARQRFRHRRSPHRRINADRVAQPNRLGNPP